MGREGPESEASKDVGGVTLPLVEEQVAVETVAVPKGTVRVHVVPRVHEETIRVPLMTEHTEVRRIPVGRFVDAAPPVRQEGDVVIVPIVEEVLVVEKRLRVREEVHLIRRTSTREEQRRVDLRVEHATVTRVPPNAPAGSS